MDDEALRALGNSNRRRILLLVRDEQRSVGDLANQLELSQPAVSQHLAVLREAGLVQVTPAGRRRLYRADDAAVAAAGRFFAEYWGDASDRLAAVAEALAAADPGPHAATGTGADTGTGASRGGQEAS